MCVCVRVVGSDVSWCMSVLSFAFVCMLTAFRETFLDVKLSE